MACSVLLNTPPTIVFLSLGMTSALFQGHGHRSESAIWTSDISFSFVFVYIPWFRFEMLFLSLLPFPSSLTWEAVCAVLWFMCLWVWPVLCEVWRLSLLILLFFCICIPPAFRCLRQVCYYRGTFCGCLISDVFLAFSEDLLNVDINIVFLKDASSLSNLFSFVLYSFCCFQ